MSKIAKTTAKQTRHDRGRGEWTPRQGAQSLSFIFRPYLFMKKNTVTNTL